ncbi:MAG: hypothetical protein ACFB4I_13190 [Cyanophyceae cyanobacterium]
MRCSRFLYFGYIGFRFLRYRFSPWIALVKALLDLLFAAGVNRATAKIRYLRAIGKINFAGVYEVINDLLW